MNTSFKVRPSKSTVHSVIDKDGKSWPTTVSSMGEARRQEIQGGFAPMRIGHAATAYTNGEAYFAAVAEAFAQAKQSIFINGWQINWDVELVPGKRLIDALKQALDREPDLRIYVMPWMSPKVGLDTGDLGTMLAIFQLNAGRKGMRALCCPAGLQNDFTGVEYTFFSHHQKQVVIDNKIGFIGGLDLAYGRRDDDRFALDHGWRQGPEIYSTCVPPMHTLAPDELSGFVSETELLRTTLSAGLLAEADQVHGRATPAAAASPLGQAGDAAWRWWQQPLPAWLTETLEGLTAPMQALLKDAQQAALARLVAKLKDGSVTPADVQAVLGKVSAVTKASYTALLGLAWATRQPHADLFRPGAKAVPSSGAVLRADQPRQPWQDVHCRIEGPAVYDLAMNFIRRWNSLQHSYLPGSRLAGMASIAPHLVPEEPHYMAKGPGVMDVRVLRSAPLKLQQQEKKAMPGLPAPTAAHTDIHDMMVAVIKGAEQFVYIENQFFQSGMGMPSIDPNTENGRKAMSAATRYLTSQAGNSIKAALTLVGRNPQGDQLPSNCIAQALGERIEHAVRWGMPFHAYIVLPVHPEGQLNDIAIVGQIHWTMQSLVYASHSLVNRVRCAIAAKGLCKNPMNKAAWQAAMVQARELSPKSDLRYYEQIKPAQWAPYLTLLNLRTCQMLGGQTRTEQIYVHSKLLIADDSHVIMGSANINDRSLAGHRDSELAVYIDDRKVVKAPLNGKVTEVHAFAHELRKALWRKHLGLSGGGNGVVQPASHLASLLARPSARSTIRAIQDLARANQAAYEQAFGFLPRSNQQSSPRTPASIWPVFNRDSEQSSLPAEAYAEQMPFAEKFWQTKASSTPPQGIKGYFTALPIRWTAGENNHPEMNKLLLTNLGPTGSNSATAVVRHGGFDSLEEQV